MYIIIHQQELKHNLFYTGSQKSHVFTYNFDSLSGPAIKLKQKL